MVEKIVLENGNQSDSYILKPIHERGEPRTGAYPPNISIFHDKPIDGHWIIQLHQTQAEFSIENILGVVDAAKGPAHLSDRIYECAVEAGKKYADNLQCSLEDNTRYQRQAQEALKKAFEQRAQDLELFFEGFEP